MARAGNHDNGLVLSLETTDYHTAGEPLRIVTAGVPAIPGDTMLAKRRYFLEHQDHIRKLLMHEPRGHAEMYGAVLTDPVTEDGDTGVLFMHNGGYSTMCGHAIIALTYAGVEQQLFKVKDPQSIRFDTPAGRVVAKAQLTADHRVQQASFQNVPSFVLEPEYSVKVDGTAVDLTIAFGGAFYAYVDASAHGFRLAPGEARELIAFGRKIKNAVQTHYRIDHPEAEEDINFLYGVIFVRQGEKPGHSRNACIFADGQLDRSPTGTGVSGRAAVHRLRGELAVGDSLHIESIIGTTFEVKCIADTTVGGLRAVIPEVSGSASLTGHHRFVLHADDPLPRGFHIL